MKIKNYDIFNRENEMTKNSSFEIPPFEEKYKDHTFKWEKYNRVFNSIQDFLHSIADDTLGKNWYKRLIKESVDVDPFDEEDWEEEDFDINKFLENEFYFVGFSEEDIFFLEKGKFVENKEYSGTYDFEGFDYYKLRFDPNEIITFVNDRLHYWDDEMSSFYWVWFAFINTKHNPDETINELKGLLLEGIVNILNNDPDYNMDQWVARGVKKQIPIKDFYDYIKNIDNQQLIDDFMKYKNIWNVLNELHTN
jgi:hypothetical protein